MSVYAHQFFFCNIVFHVRFLIFLVLQPTSIVTRNSLYNSIRHHQHSEFFDLVKSLYVKKSIDFYTLTSINTRDAQLADFSRTVCVCVCHFITLQYLDLSARLALHYCVATMWNIKVSHPCANCIATSLSYKMSYQRITNDVNKIPNRYRDYFIL